MRLTRAERDKTAREFEENLQRSGLTFDELRDLTGLSESRFIKAFLVMERGTDPADIWLIRDLLENAVRHKGIDPVPFTVLPEENRDDNAQQFETLYRHRTHIAA